MKRQLASRISSALRLSGPGRRDARSRIAALLMLAAILSVITAGVALLIFILRDLWVFIITITQP